MADSVTAAIADAVATFTNAPTLYLFDAPPQVLASQVFPPYAVLSEQGMTPQYEMTTRTVMEPTELTITVYSMTLAAVDAAVMILKYNGGAIGAGLGLDFGALPTLSGGYSDLEVRRMGERRYVLPATGKQAQRIFACDLRYRVTLYRYTTL